ncbi:MAG: hypothetical protein HOO67_06265 [Candidatus Peribacteraceae bacterium]|nr:hypothetical protein [Candidatus Peribacteraceae bacterium]
MHHGRNGHHVSDLVYIEDEPHVVLEWKIFQDGSETPNVAIRLDPKYLHPLKGFPGEDYLYEQQLYWPDEPPR